MDGEHAVFKYKMGIGEVCVSLLSTQIIAGFSTAEIIYLLDACASLSLSHG